MLIIKPDSSDIFEYPNVLSESDSIKIRFTLRPELWQANSAYIEKRDVVIPTVFNGFHYQCYSGGISKAVEPTWLTVSKGITEDLGVSWMAYPYDYLLMPNENISASTWEGINCTIKTGSDVFTNNYTQCQIGTITAGSDTITLINTATYGADNSVIKRAILIPIEAIR